MQRQQKQDTMAQEREPLENSYLKSQIARNTALADEDKARAGYYKTLPDTKKEVSATKLKMYTMMHEQAAKYSRQHEADVQKRNGRNQMIYQTDADHKRYPIGILNDQGYKDLPPDTNAQPQKPSVPPQQGMQQPQEDPRTLGGFMNHPMANTATGLSDLLRMLGLGGQGGAPQGMPPQQGGQPMPQQGGGRPITPQIAAQFLQQAGGDKEQARAMARQAGFAF